MNAFLKEKEGFIPEEIYEFPFACYMNALRTRWQRGEKPKLKEMIFKDGFCVAHNSRTQEVFFLGIPADDNKKAPCLFQIGY